MCQFEQKISEFLDCTKDMYKDLIAVGKDPTTQEIKPRSIVFRIDNVTAPSGAKAEFGDHPQHFCYVLVDQANWHCTVFANKWTRKWWLLK